MSQSSSIFPTQSLAAGFKTDLEKVVKKFSATDCVRYEVFAEIWREMKLNFLCAGRQTDREAREVSDTQREDENFTEALPDFFFKFIFPTEGRGFELETC